MRAQLQMDVGSPGAIVAINTDAADRLITVKFVRVHLTWPFALHGALPLAAAGVGQSVMPCPGVLAGSRLWPLQLPRTTSQVCHTLHANIDAVSKLL
jgi:hypothetical protein